MNVVIGSIAVLLGVLYGFMSWAQAFKGRTVFLLRKPAVQPSPQRLRQGGLIGLFVALLVFTIGISYLITGAIGQDIATGVWIAFIVVCLVGIVYSRLRKRHSASS